MQVIALASAAAFLGWAKQSRTIRPGQSLAAFIDELESDHPRLREIRGRVRFAVNDRYAAGDQLLQPRDEVAIIPPVSGG